MGDAPAAPQPSAPRERICIPAFLSVYCGPEDTPAPAPPAEAAEQPEPAEPVAGLPEIVSQASLEMGVPTPVVRHLRVGVRRQRVPVGNKEKAAVLFLHLQEIYHSTVIIT